MYQYFTKFTRILSPKNTSSVYKFSNKIVYANNFKEGDTASVTKKITQEDVHLFTEITGDTNPIHFQSDKPVVHGALLNGLVSGVIGSQLPGPGTLVISQTLFFPNKCFVDEFVTVTVELVENRKIMKVKFWCIVENQNKIVLDGEAKLKFMTSNA